MKINNWTSPTKNIFFLIVFSVLLWGYRIFSPAFDIQKSVYIYISEKTNYHKLLKQLTSQARIKNLCLFKQLAFIVKYSKHMKTGRYELTSHINYLQTIRLFLKGRQAPIKLIFNNIRLKQELAQRIGNQLCLDSEKLLDQLNNSITTNTLGFDTSTISSMFIPNTYEMYWNISIQELLRKMKKEYDFFWNTKRLKKAKSISLTPIEISILASIVEEETNLPKEYPIIAGVYINRLKKGMFLQADPTIKFAAKNFFLKRILLKNLKINSPYNTYKNHGLPPGPIRIPSIAAIDGVLNYTPHEYLYMCAMENLSGKHCFSKTWKEHSKNAKKYRTKLNQLDIW